MPGSRRYLIAVFCGLLLLGGLAPGLPAERLPPEVEAIRAERERQREALDRIRGKVEVPRETEAERSEEGQTRQPAEGDWMGTEQEQVEWEEDVEANRWYRQLLKELEEIAFRLQVWIWAETLLPWIPVVYGAFFLFLLFAPYRLYIDSWLTHSGVQRHPLLLGGSALCGAGAGWMLSQGEVNADPETALALGGLGLYAWFFLPGFLWFFVVFLHSLVVPHPMEATFKRVLRGEKLSREEVANLAEAMYHAKRDGIPADWRVRSQLRRLERLTQLMEKEKVFLDLMRESLLQQQRGERGK